ncbi:NADH-quinone oxidoreductase subunit N [Bacteroides caecigallinarum]|uniref:NADH-quinone oxidoreductase subunit N n=1 Tax=Bacteroides caecigallinarum TaxID=1411144 RepID=UPI001EF636DE|nr:NADH-quinone oxidoreductase subunit N [Bacteroides caecigallinarum]
MFQFIPMQAEISMALMIVIILIADLVMKAPHNKTLQTIACTLMVIQLIMNIEPSAGEFFGGMYHCTPVTSVVKTILTAGTLLVFLQAGEWISAPDTRHKAGEFYVITLSTLLGMYFMVSAGSFIMFYVGLELASIPMACLIAFDKWKHHSAEAGAKFILNSMFSSGLMLYGLSLIYGTCGTTYFADMTASITGTPLQILAMVFFFAGLGFKLSLVPFHMWTPDTYQGAPTAVAGYLSVISKGAAAFALMSILTKVFAPMADRWALMLSIVIVLTITVANIFAILQDNMKRFMAYSSISQAGYIMLAVMAGNTQGTTSLIYYITVYIVANLAVFGVIGAVERHALRTTVDADMAEGELPENTLSRSEETAASERAVSRSAYAGLYRTNPRLTFVMTLAMFSLAGIPPFAGFFSKFFVFASAFNTGHWLVVFLALVNTVISLYYYLLVVKAMYITPNENPLPYFRSSWLTRISLAVCLAGIILLGIISSVYGGIETVAGM